jgi:hypothetical protein
MHPTIPAFSLLLVGAYCALTVAGALLWKATKSPASALIALGFGTALVDQVILITNYIRTINHSPSQPGDTLFIVYHLANSFWVVAVGMSVAALGFVWHTAIVLRHR